MSETDVARDGSPIGGWRAAGEREHFVQFYEDDAALVGTVDDFIRTGLQSGAGAVVIATQPHLTTLEQRWAAQGVDLGAARHRGGYVPLDAAHTLSRFLVDGWPRADLFMETIEPVVANAAKHSSRVVAFGEMVALLWKDGHHDASIRLEELWNDLAKKYSFALFCAYPMSGDNAPVDALRRVCASHARSIPSESFVRLATSAERMAEICDLQHRAKRLEEALTGRKSVERALARRERELADFLENGAEALHSVGPDGRILWANQAELDLMGYARQDYVGRPMADFHVDPDVCASILQRLLAGETLRDVPARLRTRQGSIKLVLISSNALVEGDTFIHSRCFTRDVTALKQAEEALRLADQRKDEFLAMLGHELRNPLAPIRNVTEVLRRTAADSPIHTQVCETLDRQVQQMTKLLDDLLDLSRITQGKIQFRLEPIDLQAVVTRAVETSRPFIEERRHRLTVAVPEAPVPLRGDLTRLVQALGNMLNNAAKYTPEGGQISLAVLPQASSVDVRVRDNGIGIAPALLPHVFDLFVQADQSLERPQGGLGIGLTLVRRIVEQHGGQVAAFSAGQGQGSEISFSLPLRQEPRVEAARSGPKDSRSTVTLGRRILVVDDNRDAAESMAILLRMRKHEVVVAFDGFAAVEQAAAFAPEVVLLDIGLPGMNGYEVARHLRAQGSAARLVAITGYGQSEDQRRARDAGFDDHLVKPVAPALIEQLLESPPGSGALRR